MIKNTIIMIGTGLDIVRSDSGLGHTREKKCQKLPGIPGPL